MIDGFFYSMQCYCCFTNSNWIAHPTLFAVDNKMFLIYPIEMTALTLHNNLYCESGSQTHEMLQNTVLLHIVNQ